MSVDSSSLSAQVNRLSTADPAVKQDNAPSELVAMVDDLLNHLENKFSTVSNDLITKLDEMTRRLDNLEATIQAGNNSSEAEQQK